MWTKSNIAAALPLVFLVLLTGCSSSTVTGPDDSGPTASNNDASFNKADYPVFINPDQGADPAVSAEQGGKGFTAEGWVTNLDFDLIGDPRAVKGGMFRDVATDFPTTLSPEGPNTSLFNLTLKGMVYETLLNLHPTTMEYMPILAT